MKDFIKISKYAGMREDLVQGAGGNSSVKISDDSMYIKASGYALSDIKQDYGYATINQCIIKNAFLNTDLDSLKDEEANQLLQQAHIRGDRPSIETFLHSLSYKYTLHTHPVVVNALCCRKDAKNVLKTLFRDSLVISYKTPGIELAKAYFNEFNSKLTHNPPKVSVVFFLNHGLMVSADSSDLVIDTVESVLLKIEEYLKIGK